jgi:GNAT superfamily N-acetyltransferase
VIPFRDGDPVPGEWWSARDGGPDGEVVGYGRLDIGWGGDAQILLAVDPSRQEEGIGSFVLARLEDEAAARGINYVYNTIREHEDRDLVHDWLVVRGFRGSVAGDLRKRVGSAPAEPTRQPRDAASAYDVSSDPGGRAPGQEEQGGYVDVDDHRY